MSTNGDKSVEDAEMADCDGEKVVTMMDVLQEQEEFEEDANAVLGASDEKNCTYSKGYIKRQAIYACLTCCIDTNRDPTKGAGVCLACSLACHENHELVELYTKRNFRCDCGNTKFNSHPCQFTPNKPDLNEENHYDQNFSGLYCICHRPYPDPEATEEDEMIQCIICEDWLHASHLGAAIPNESYAEMVCKGCMDKNEFLHDYSEFAVNNETADVEVSDILIGNSISECNAATDGDTECVNKANASERMEVDTNKKDKPEEASNSDNKHISSEVVPTTEKRNENLSTTESNDNIESDVKTNESTNDAGDSIVKKDDSDTTEPEKSTSEELAHKPDEPTTSKETEKSVTSCQLNESATSPDTAESKVEKSDAIDTVTDPKVRSDETMTVEAEISSKTDEKDNVDPEVDNKAQEPPVLENKNKENEDKDKQSNNDSTESMTVQNSAALTQETESKKSPHIDEHEKKTDALEGLSTDNEVTTDNNEEKINTQENKRKLSTEQCESVDTNKKAKLSESEHCIRPKGVKRIFHGATFWPSTFRQKLCTCNICITMYKDLSVLFLIDSEDTVTAYETLGKEKTDGNSASQYEKGLQALSSLDRIHQINALTEYNKMRDKLLDFLKSFKDRKEVVKEEDIKSFFAGMKPKREPDGVYFCR